MKRAQGVINKLQQYLKLVEMKKFKFVGDPEEYSEWDKPPVVNMVFDEKTHAKYYGSGAEYGWITLETSSNWEEVFEDEPNVLHKDTDLGYFAGLAMQGLIANAPNGHLSNFKEGAPLAIEWAEELIKLLNEQNK